MRQSIIALLVGSVALLAARPACAQSSDGGYSAPGFPMSFSHRLPPPVAKPDAIVSPLLTRFWHDPVNGRERASDFYKFMSNYLKYPDAATKAGMVGRIFVRLTIAPNGRVSNAQVVNSRTLSRLAAQPTPADALAGTAALEAETLRIFRAARFLVAKEKADTVTVSASFQIE